MVPRISHVRTIVRSTSMACRTSASVTAAARARMPSRDARLSCAWSAVVRAVAASGDVPGRTANPSRAMRSPSSARRPEPVTRLKSARTHRHVLMGRMSRRAVRVLALVVAAILALLVVIDRVGDYVAERIAADTIKSAQHLPSRPDVDIAGFPFLNQLITGKYDKITVTADDVPVGTTARPLVLSRVQVVLHSL